MKTRIINRQNIDCCENEFIQVKHPLYQTLNSIPKLANYERMIGFLKDLSLDIFDGKINLVHTSTISHGGFFHFELSSSFDKIFIYDDPEKKTIFTNNIKFYDSKLLKTIFIFDNFLTIISSRFLNEPYILYIEEWKNIPDQILESAKIIISKTYLQKISSNFQYIKFSKKYSEEAYLYIRNEENIIKKFYQNFRYYMKYEDIIDYDNLIHLCMIVKNSGPNFINILLQNLYIIDRWTIIDTGSIDGTDTSVQIALKDKKGKLYKEEFIDFGTTRNRCLDLAGTSCKFIIMLDDTYVVNGNLRQFLMDVRSDQFADSFSLYIKNNSCEYVSNRIIKADRKLKYIYKIHEVITPENNNNVVCPREISFIHDVESQYMFQRTLARKQKDILMLLGAINENPEDSRNYYYLAQTYSCITDFQNAYKYYKLRFDHPNVGLLQEKIDAAYEAGILAKFHFQKPWESCKRWFEKAHELDPTRPESIFMIGLHHYLFDRDYKKAYFFMKKAYDIGYPQYSQFMQRPAISYTHIPDILIDLCYKVRNYILGEEVCEFFLRNNSRGEKYDIVQSWKKIFNLLNTYNKNSEITAFKRVKPIIIFMLDFMGGLSVIKQDNFPFNIINEVQKSGKYSTIVFGNFTKTNYIKHVNYLSKCYLLSFIKNNDVKCVINFNNLEYLSVLYESRVEKIILFFNSIDNPCRIFSDGPKLKSIMCPTNKHKRFFTNFFSDAKTQVNVFPIACELNNKNTCSDASLHFMCFALTPKERTRFYGLWKNIMNAPFFVGKNLYLIMYIPLGTEEEVTVNENIIYISSLQDILLNNNFPHIDYIFINPEYHIPCEFMMSMMKNKATIVAQSMDDYWDNIEYVKMNEMSHPDWENFIIYQLSSQPVKIMHEYNLNLIDQNTLYSALDRLMLEFS